MPNGNCVLHGLISALGFVNETGRGMPARREFPFPPCGSHSVFVAICPLVLLNSSCLPLEGNGRVAPFCRCPFASLAVLPEPEQGAFKIACDTGGPRPDEKLDAVQSLGALEGIANWGSSDIGYWRAAELDRQELGKPMPRFGPPPKPHRHTHKPKQGTGNAIRYTNRPTQPSFFPHPWPCFCAWPVREHQISVSDKNLPRRRDKQKLRFVKARQTGDKQ